jgi:hypothetical protein
MNESTLFEYKNAVGVTLRLVAVPCDGPRGNRLRAEITEAGAAGEQPIALSIDLLEGPARQLHLAARAWVRKQKELRGDTPRGQRKFLQRQLSTRARPAETASATLERPGSAR